MQHGFVMLFLSVVDLLLNVFLKLLYTVYLCLHRLYRISSSHFILLKYILHIITACFDELFLLFFLFNRIGCFGGNFTFQLFGARFADWFHSLGAIRSRAKLRRCRDCLLDSLGSNERHGLAFFH